MMRFRKLEWGLCLGLGLLLGFALAAWYSGLAGRAVAALQATGPGQPKAGVKPASKPKKMDMLPGPEGPFAGIVGRISTLR